MKAGREPRDSVYRPEPLPKRPKIPPITIPRGGNVATSFNAARGKITSVTNKFQIRFGSTGMKLHPEDQKAHTQIIKCLNDNSINYFTHPFEDQKPRRFVLYGLDKYELPQTKQMLQETGLKPIDVKYMFTKAPKYHEHWFISTQPTKSL